MITHDTFSATDDAIGEQWRLLMGNISQDYAGILNSGIQDLLGQAPAIRPGNISISSAGPLMDTVNPQLEQLVNKAGKTAAAAQGPPESAAKDSADIPQPVLECVQEQRGGPNTHFTFVLPAARNGQPELAEGNMALGGNQVVNKVAGRKLLLGHFGNFLHPNLAGYADAPPSAAAQQHTTGLQRVVGHRGQQQVLTGAAILQRRRSLTSLLPGGARYSWLCREKGLAVDLSAECSSGRMDTISSLYGTVQGKDATGSTGTLGLPPIGIDPVFVITSRMYDPQVALNPSDWYNTSKGSGQLNQQGIPFGFFPKIFPGEGALYPVIIDINLREEMLPQRLLFLKEGAFLDPFATDSCQFKIASFSVDTELYGYMSMYAAYDDAGFIRTKFEIEAHAHRDYSFEGLKMRGMVARLANDLVLFVLMLLYCALTCRDIALSIQAQRRRKSTIAKLLTRTRRQSIHHTSLSGPQRSVTGRTGQKSFSAPQSFSIIGHGGRMSPRGSAPGRLFPDASRGRLSSNADVFDDENLPSAFHVSTPPDSSWKPQALTALPGRPLPLLTHPDSPPNPTVFASESAFGTRKVAWSTLLAERERSFGSSPQLGKLQVPRELQEQHTGHSASLPRPIPVLRCAQRSNSGPICEGLGVPAFSTPSHQPGPWAEDDRHTSSDDEEDRRSSVHEVSEKSSDDGGEESSTNSGGDAKSSDDGGDGKSAGEESNDDSGSSSFVEDIDKCVDDYPIQGRSSAASFSSKAHIHPRERRHLGREGHLHVEEDFYRGRMHIGWIGYETCLCALMLAAIALLFYYAFYLQPNKAPTERRAIVYDSVSSKAHPFLLHLKSDGTEQESRQGMPGAAGRWAEGQESEAGLQAFGDMLKVLEQMSAVKTAYNLVQSFTLILLSVRFVYHTSFQPKLSVIAGTIARFIPDVLYFLCILLAFGTMLSALLAIVFGGGSYSGVSSVSEGLLVVFKAIISGSEASLMRFLRAAADGQNMFSNAAMVALAWVVIFIVSLVFLFLMDILVAIILRPYARLRRGSIDAPGIPDDLAALFRWLMLTFKGSPSGLELVKFLSFLQHKKRAGDKIGLATLSQIVISFSRVRLSSLAPPRIDKLKNRRASVMDRVSYSQTLRKLSILPKRMSGRQSSVVFPETPGGSNNGGASNGMQQQGAAPFVSEPLPIMPSTPQAIGRSQVQVRQ
ncbi:hypothetical protein DUNSADRAFT_11700 [Dunaliella salina]|uniref:Polycystin cation channel PKD1/PKD2 domain-containing protein n=1 Tax=Dunaliella salina TaxID=3046 RepID=A0ABQ7GCT5_DUNSA|nr:hypothetical protein DUNSADRAFT_11700 [Dunaliella salina]|eukprot:KAF5832417.1 hypothetical protein DUNSADRAFT_11700 [Dunaliella salina]